MTAVENCFYVTLAVCVLAMLMSSELYTYCMESLGTRLTSHKKMVFWAQMGNGGGYTM